MRSLSKRSLGFQTYEQPILNFHFIFRPLVYIKKIHIANVAPASTAVMSRYDVLRREEAVGAGRAAAQAGVIGAARWGVGFAILGGLGYAISPIYRGLTIQFKTYEGLFFAFPLSNLTLLNTTTSS